MFTLLLLVAVGFVALRMAARLNALETTIAEIRVRLQALEARVSASAQSTMTSPSTAAVPPPRPEWAIPRAEPIRPPVVPERVQPTAAIPPSRTSERAQMPPRDVDAVPRQPASSGTAPMAALADVHRHQSSRDTLERRIGSRWLLYVGVVAIVVGVSYFEKLAIDNHWVGETARVMQGAGVGLLLISAGLQFVRKGDRLYGQILSGCGIAILYVSTYAAFNVYHLIGQLGALALMSIVTALAAWLADRQRSQGLALVAVGGGFATPFLLPTGHDAEVALFGYDAFLIAGTLLLARRRDWPTLNVISYAFTVLTMLAWATRFYEASKFVTTEIFLTMFCGMFLSILREVRDSKHRSAPAERAILWTAPILYYLGSLSVLWAHSTALLIFLLTLTVLGVAISSRAAAWVRLACWCAVAMPLLFWSDDHGVPTWIAAGLATWSGVYVLNLIGLLDVLIRTRRSFTTPDIGVLHANALAACGGAYLLLDPMWLDGTAAVAALLAAVNAAIAYGLFRTWRTEALHFIALTFTLTTVAIGVHFDGPWVTSGWAAEGVVLAWLALRERRHWLRAGGLLLFGVAVGRLIVSQFESPAVGQWALLNARGLCGLFIVALAYGLTFAHRRLGSSETRPLEVGIGLLLAKLLLLSVGVSELSAYWTLHTPPPPFEPHAAMLDVAFVIGGLIMWLGLTRQQEWLRAAGAAVVGVSACLLFGLQLQPAPVGYVSILNARAAAGAVGIATLSALARVHGHRRPRLIDRSTNIAIMTTGASLLALALLTSEIDAYWTARGAADMWSMARQGLHAIAWAGVGAFLVWQGVLNRRLWVRATGGTLLAVAVGRLLQLHVADVRPSYIVVANARVMASSVIVALLYGLAQLYRRADGLVENAYSTSAVLWLLANALTLTLLTSEITAYWHVQDVRRASDMAESHFAREMMVSITWAVYATLLIVVGLWKRYAPIRYFAIAVFVITIAKVFAIDLAELARFYRVLSVVGLGVMLLLTSYLYHHLNAEPTAVESDGTP